MKPSINRPEPQILMYRRAGKLYPVPMNSFKTDRGLHNTISRLYHTLSAGLFN